MEISKGGSSFSYYAILGLSSNSNNEEIKRAYRKLALVSGFFFFVFFI